MARQETIEIGKISEGIVQQLQGEAGEQYKWILYEVNELIDPRGNSIFVLNYVVQSLCDSLEYLRLITLPHDIERLNIDLFLVNCQGLYDFHRILESDNRVQTAKWRQLHYPYSEMVASVRKRAGDVVAPSVKSRQHDREIQLWKNRYLSTSTQRHYMKLDPPLGLFEAENFALAFHWKDHHPMSRTGQQQYTHHHRETVIGTNYDEKNIVWEPKTQARIDRTTDTAVVRVRFPPGFLFLRNQSAFRFALWQDSLAFKQDPKKLEVGNNDEVESVWEHPVRGISYCIHWNVPDAEDYQEWLKLSPVKIFGEIFRNLVYALKSEEIVPFATELTLLDTILEGSAREAKIGNVLDQLRARGFVLGEEQAWDIVVNYCASPGWNSIIHPVDGPEKRIGIERGENSYELHTLLHDFLGAKGRGGGKPNVRVMQDLANARRNLANEKLLELRRALASLEEQAVSHPFNETKYKDRLNKFVAKIREA